MTVQPVTPPMPDPGSSVSRRLADHLSEPERPPGLRVRVHHPASGLCVVEAEGVLDAAVEPRFADPLRQRPAQAADMTVLDLSSVTFLATVGAVTMLEAETRAVLRGVDLVVVSSPAVDRLLRLLDVADRFTYAATVEQAAAQLARRRCRP